MTPRPREWLAACVLIIVALLAWRNSIESGFVFDNKTLLLEDTRIRKATPENVALILHHTYWWPNEESGLYRPITTLSYLFNYAILGNADRPAGYHWINLLLHIGNAFLVLALARRIVPDFWPPFLIALVWAVHPVLTESVTNIVGRADLLAGMTVLGGLLIYLKSTEATGWRRAAWLAGLTAVTAVGVFCKESAVVVVAIVALYELTWWKQRAPVREKLRGFLLGCLAMAPPLLAMWWVRSRILSAAAPTRFPYVDNPIVGADFWTGRLTAVKVMAKYLGLLVWPARLSPDYSYAQIPLIGGRPADWVAWIVVAAAALVVAFLYRRNKAAFFAAGFAFLTFLPTSNLVIPIGTIMAERFLYLPAIGFSICLILALYFLCRRVSAGALPVVLGLLIATAFGVRTWARNADWRDDYSLWSAAVRTSPLSFKSHTGLAQALHADHSPLDAVLLENERSVAILDHLPDRLNSAIVYLRTGAQYIEWGSSLRKKDREGNLLPTPESAAKFERAKVLLLRAVSILKAQHEADREKGLERIDPQLRSTEADANAWLMLSGTEQRLGEIEESLRSARQARDVGPMRVEVFKRIHDVLLSSGRRDEAMAVLMQGMILTSNPVLQRMLVADYSDRPDESKCAISFAQAAPAIDFSCGAVRKLACSVSGEVISAGLKTGGPDRAAHIRKELAAKYGCPQTP